MILHYNKFETLPKEKISSYEEILDNVPSDLHLSQALPDYLYVVFRALTADVPNLNGDLFDTEELERYDSRHNKKVYETFNGKSIFTNHQSQKVENSIGVIFDSNFDKTNPEDKYVEIVFGIDREKAGDIARGVETGRLKNGSMGCSISHSLCTICDKEIHTEKDMCSHLKFHRNQMVLGKRAAERLRGVSFQEYSIVTSGADPRANLKYIVSSVIDYKRLPKAADQMDVFGLMNLVCQEVRTASLTEKFKISETLDTVLGNITSCVVSKEDFSNYDINKAIDEKLTNLFNYIVKAQYADLPGKIKRPISTSELRDYVGREVEVSSDGKIYLLS